MFQRIKKLWQKTLFKPGDRVRCPICGSVFTLFKWQENFPQGYHATVKVIKEEPDEATTT